MEDADSSATRKRPRLDSGDSTYRSMSADRLRTAPTEPRPAHILSTPPHNQTPAQALEAASIYPPMSLTPSKVTINVRASAKNSSPLQMNGQPETTTSLRGGAGAGGEDYPMSLEEPSSKMDTSSPNVISVGSTPQRSPEIEVAEIEDMNDDPVETRWQPLARQRGLVDARQIQQALLATFPYFTSGRPRKTLTLVAGVLEKGEFLGHP
ncbi:hypothetical protein P7C71_g3350, partial [Lecanoromycetidae sp. Uapishka_2]